MGAGPSRRVVVEQDTEGVMVSDAMMGRLAQYAQQGASTTTTDNYNGNADNEATSRGVNANDASAAASSADVARVQAAWRTVRSQKNEIKEIVKQASQKAYADGYNSQQSQHEKELYELDVQWQQRIDEHNAQREKDLANEFKERVTKLSEGFKLGCKDMSCQEEQTAVKTCYNNNPGRTLNCSDEVQAFVACAEKARVEWLESQ